MKPRYDAWLPDSTIEQHVDEVLPAPTPRDVGTFGFLLLFALRRSSLTRPFFRMPQPDGGVRVPGRRADRVGPGRR